MMSKDKQLMEWITQDIIARLVDSAGMNVMDAMTVFYNSAFCEKLYDKETGLYLEGTDYLYEIFSDELQSGRLIQKEI